MVSILSVASLLSDISADNAVALNETTEINSKIMEVNGILIIILLPRPSR